MIILRRTAGSLSCRRLDHRYTTRCLPLLILVAVTFVGCPTKVVRVPVPAEDILRSNQAVKEADLSFTRRDYYAALIKYLEAARLNPNSEYVYNKCGIAYSQLKFYTQASSCFQRCIALNSKFTFAYNNLGSVYFAMSDMKKAEKYFKKAISMNPNSASFHINLGSVFMERKQFDKGMAEWRKGLALDPGVLNKSDAVSLSSSGRSPMERYYFLARLYASLGDVDHSVENLQLALNAGFTNISLIESEHDFDRIRAEEKFVAFMKTAMLLVTPRPTP